MEKDKAVVKLGMGFTINLGQYESARIDAGVEIQGEKANMPQLWKEAEKEILNQINSQVEILKKSIDEKKTLLGMNKGPSFK